MLGCFVKGFVNTDSRLDLDLSLDLFIYFGGFGSRSYVAFRFGQTISLILLVLVCSLASFANIFILSFQYFLFCSYALLHVFRWNSL